VLFLQAFEQVEWVRQQLRTRPRRLQAHIRPHIRSERYKTNSESIVAGLCAAGAGAAAASDASRALALPSPPHLSGALRVTALSGAASYLAESMTYQAAFTTLRNQPQS